MASKTGVAELPLHSGRAPRWLFARMVRLADNICTVIVDEYGPEELLRRFGDTYWFQSFGCVLGYDWHSSGVTTVVTGALREALKPESHGMGVCGGKGRRSRFALDDIEAHGKAFCLSSDQVGLLKYASRMCAKVDTAAIQAGYTLYHHAFFVTEEGKWAAVQQGMSVADRTARRYHWVSEHLRSFAREPHDAIVGDAVREVALDMVANESEGCQRASLDLVKEGVGRIRRDLLSLRPKYQRGLAEWVYGLKEAGSLEVLKMPRTVNWDALRGAYELQPTSYEELLGVQGIGPATTRALALISELIYGARPSWKDPVKYSFAFGGKDGVPRPVDRRAMDAAIAFLENALYQAKIGEKERVLALQRLKSYTLIFQP